MAQMNNRNRSVDAHSFAMVPRADIPRSSFRRQSAHKTTFDPGLLVPVFLDEVLPGDSFHFSMTLFCRMSTPIFPVMDNLVLESFFFFVPNRLVWENWVNMMGEQVNPGDSISYTVPEIVGPVDGYDVASLQDYFGLPTVGQVASGNQVTHNALPLRAYNLIYNDWFRDENLINSVPFNTGAGPDPSTNYVILSRGKRHDYFTGCLPFTQKGNPVQLPLGATAPVISAGAGNLGEPTWNIYDGSTTHVVGSPTSVNASLTPNNGLYWSAGVPANAGNLVWNSTGLVADLSSATAATINQIRQAFQIQKLLERDARGGTRYTEIVRSHFGVVSPDARLQRPEYLGGGTSPVNFGAVPQTSGTGASGTTSPQGNLAAFSTTSGRGHGFSYSATEHGHIIGLVCVRADLSYQQGMRKLWSRQTRYDFYFPVFAMLGEQAVLNREIYCDGSNNDNGVFGYQERWAEYRYFPAMVTSFFRSTAAGTLDSWHLAQHFTALPTLNSTFITERVPLARVLAAGSDAQNLGFIADFFFDIKTARPLPMFSVPGMVDHF